MIHINDHNYSRQIAKLSGASFNPEVDQSIVRVKNSILLGGVIFTDYTGFSIGMHVASVHPNWISRNLLYVTFDYPFNQLGVENIFGVNRISNTKAIAFCTKVGFNEVGRLDGYYPNEPVVFYRMSRAECRWLGVKPRNLEVC